MKIKTKWMNKPLPFLNLNQIDESIKEEKSDKNSYRILPISHQRATRLSVNRRSMSQLEKSNQKRHHPDPEELHDSFSIQEKQKNDLPFSLMNKHSTLKLELEVIGKDLDSHIALVYQKFSNGTVNESRSKELILLAHNTALNSLIVIEKLDFQEKSILLRKIQDFFNSEITSFKQELNSLKKVIEDLTTNQKMLNLKIESFEHDIQNQIQKNFELNEDYKSCLATNNETRDVLYKKDIQIRKFEDQLIKTKMMLLMS
jgi:hypothetical protein